MTARFDGTELLKWAEGPFMDGAHARAVGATTADAPKASTYGSYTRQSWLAGWTDQDSAMRAGYFSAAPNACCCHCQHGTPSDEACERCKS